MPGYVVAVLCRFHHNTLLCPKYKLAKHTPISYRSKIQKPIAPNKSLCFNVKGVHCVQQAVNCLLVYALAFNFTILVSLGNLASAKSISTENTAKALTKLLNYAATNPDTEITYHKSDVILYIDSDALYL